MDYPYNMPQYGNQDYAMPARLNAVMKGVYLRMTLGLVVTAIVSLFASSSGFINFMAMHSSIMWILMLAEIGLVMAISAGINKMQSSTAFMLFVLFSVVNGLALSPIFVIYTGASIFRTFIICAATFAAMSVYGYTTNRDLTRTGSILIMLLIGLIIASVINIFVHSTGLYWIISFAGVAIFVGLTAWDTQQIKTMAQVMPASSAGHIATLGALSLYLDFINLFLYLLRFFGSNRD